MAGILIPEESLNKKQPVKKYILWGKLVCPKCHTVLIVNQEKPKLIDINFGAYHKKELLSYTTYKCPNRDYDYADYDCYYKGEYIPLVIKGGVG